LRLSCFSKTMVVLLWCIITLQSCLFAPKRADIPSLPLIEISFEDTISNSGILPVIVTGDGNVSYTEGISGNALDLSALARYRKPVVINMQSNTSLGDYQGITILIWVKRPSDDNSRYVILSQKNEDEELSVAGWSLSAAVNGSWKWWMSDGINELTYEPTIARQPLNDERWHLVGFSVDNSAKEARLYYDGRNVAVYCLRDLNFEFDGTSLVVGTDPFSDNPLRDTFNGKLDEFTVWSRVLSSGQIAAIYNSHLPYKHREIRKMPDSLTVLTWNIWNGGQHLGKHVGVQRVAEMIKASGADIVSLQETFGSGEKIADYLDYYYFRRSAGLSILSRFPLGRTYDIYRSRNAGAVTIELPRKNQVVICPVALSYLPNVGPYILSGHADPDTLIAREMETRGAEMRFIVWELQTLLNQSEQVPVILAGDFNSGSHMDWTPRNKDNRHGLVVEFPASRILANSGFLDSYRIIYQDEVVNPGFTWSPLFREVLQDRINFIYYHGSRLDPSWSNVLDSHSLGFPSDHAAVVTSFKWK
jgi:endonuclease/exonuclease/phosphatase family metal-dependent hydrolase